MPFCLFYIVSTQRYIAFSFSFLKFKSIIFAKQYFISKINFLWKIYYIGTLALRIKYHY